MRESFGGAFMLKLALIFIIIFISFMAVAINYAKAFRVKNEVINIIEQNQYSGIANDPVIDDVDYYLNSVGYSYGDRTILKNHCEQENGGNLTNGSTFTTQGACIIAKGSEAARYYKIITYIYIEMPFFQLNMTIPISGETKIIYN